MPLPPPTPAPLAGTASADSVSQVAVSGVLLAAGESKRFPGPEPKQLADFLGEPLVRRQARTLLAASLSEVLVVVGHAAERVMEALSGLPVTAVDNPRYRQGQSTSVAAAVERLAATSAAALFVPCDQPLLTAEHLSRLVWAFRRTGAPIIVPAFRGRRGAPVLFGRRFFAALAGLEGDAGGRQLLSRYADLVATVALDEEEALWDADTPEELDALRRRAREPEPGGAL